MSALAAPGAPQASPRTRNRLLRALFASILAVALIVTGFVMTTKPAAAAGPGTGYGTWGDTTFGFHGSFSNGDGNFIYCVEPDIPIPTGATTDRGYWGSVSGVDGDRLAGINAIITKYGQVPNTSDANRRQAVAVATAVKAVVDYNKTVYSFGYNGQYGADLGGHIRWIMARHVGGGAELQDIIDKANAYYSEAMNTRAGSVGGGTGQFTWQVDPFNNYNGTVTVSVSPANATGTVTLTNGVFTANGTNKMTGVRNGQVLGVQGVPPANTPSYKIAATGDFSAPGGGYAASVRVYTTPGQQTAAGPGQLAVQTFSFFGEDPVARSGQFIPALSTAATRYVQEGESFEDQVTFFTVADDNGVNNPWRQNGTQYAPIAAKGTLYGPYASQPTVRDDVPAGAPVAATASITTTTAKGPGTYTASSGTARQSGFYTWVWEIHQADQSPNVRAVVPAGYSFVDRFGLTAETSIVPMKPVASSQVSDNWATPGEQVTDSLTVSNSNGLWLEGVAARYEGTAYGVPNGSVPTVAANAPGNAVPLGTRTLTFTEPGTKSTSPLTVPDNFGSIVWVWKFVGAAQAQPNMFANGYEWQDQFGLVSETTRIHMRPTISTQVVSAIPAGAFDDRVTLSVGNGHWIDGAAVKVSGTLYGPLLSRPAEGATPPAGTPVAHQTSLTFTGPGQKTSNTGFTPKDAGYYTWVWDFTAAEQNAATAQSMPDGYAQRDRFGLVAETSFVPMRPDAVSKVVQDISGTGQSASDTLTASNSNGAWLTGAQMTFRGTAYAVPSGERPKVSEQVPANARSLGSQTLTFTAEGQKKTSARVEIPHDAGYIVWTWEFVTADQPAAQRANFPAGYSWRDDFGLPEETTVVQFHPTISTQVVQRVPDVAFNDTLVASTSRGQWVNGTEVVADGTLYGPFSAEPKRSSDIPEDAPVAFKTKMTLDHAGEYVTDTGFRPEKSGYYVWVWSIDFDKQTLDTRDLLPPAYTFQDDFGIRAETHILPMIPSAFTNVMQEVADAGTRVHDTLTVSNTNGEWIDGAVATYEGTAYSVVSPTAPKPGDAIPANAVKIFETTLEVDGPGTHESASVVVPDDAGFIVWVWEFHQANQADKEKWLRDMVWRDQFGLAEETTTITFEPVMTTQVASRVPNGAFNDIVTMSAARGQWHDGTKVITEGALYGPFADTPKPSDTVPEGAEPVFETTLTFDGPGSQKTDTDFRPTEAGHYTWVWTVNEETQSEKTHYLLPDDYTFSDRFGLFAETSVAPMVLNTVTEVAHPELALGQATVDTMNVSVENGEWIQVDGENIPVEYRGRAYFVPGAEAPEQDDTVPADAELLDTVTMTVTGPGDYVMPASRGEEYRQGFITWVWEIADADQAEEFRGMTDEWVDDFGVPAETAKVLLPKVETLSQAGSGLGGTIRDTAFVTETMPVRGAELTFEAYAIPMVQDEDGKWVIDYPATEPTPGEESPATEDDLDETPAPTPAPDKEQDWSWVVNEENLIGSNRDGGEFITENGTYHSEDYTVSDYRKVLWVESLWTVPMEPPVDETVEEGEELPGTEPTEELGAEYKRNLIHRGVVGIPNETSFVVDVKTYAMSASGQNTGVEHGVETWDTAELTGYVPENGTIEFEAYVVPVGDSAKVAEQCTTERLAWTSPSVALDGGLYPEGSPLEVTGDAHVFNPDVDSALYWVAVVKDELGREVHRGLCGDPDETIGLKGQKLIATDAPFAIGGAVVGLLLLSGLFFAISRRRRNAA